MLVGFICTGVKDPESQWLEQLLPAASSGSAGLEAARVGLRALANETRVSFEDPDYGFALPFPNDGHPLTERAAALHDWVRGFLYAFGALGPRGPGLSPEGQAILRDLLELTRLDLDALADGETQDEDEAALTELTEYLRVAALLLHAECQDAAAPSTPPAPR